MVSALFVADNISVLVVYFQIQPMQLRVAFREAQTELNSLAKKPECCMEGEDVCMCT